jgi:putative transcriptional regulator
MKKKKMTAGESMIAGARQALAFARGEPDHGCIVHIPEEIDVKAIRKKVNMSQEEFARQFGFSKRTLEHWEHGRRVPTGPRLSDGHRPRTGRRTPCADGAARALKHNDYNPILRRGTDFYVQCLTQETDSEEETERRFTYCEESRHRLSPYRTSPFSAGSGPGSGLERSV